MSETQVFTPATIGGLRLRNRFIRSAAFEGMCPGGEPTDSLVDYHRRLAAGGVGMTYPSASAQNSARRAGSVASNVTWNDRAMAQSLRGVGTLTDPLALPTTVEAVTACRGQLPVTVPTIPSGRCAARVRTASNESENATWLQATMSSERRAS